MGIGLTFTAASVALMVRAITAEILEDPFQKEIMAANQDQPRIYEENCHLDYYATQPQPELCSYGRTDSQRVVILFGDLTRGTLVPRC